MTQVLPIKGVPNRKHPDSRLQRLFATLHHLWLLQSFWWVATDVEQRALLTNNQECNVKDPPRFGRRNWRVKLNGELETVTSDRIVAIKGSM